MPAARRVGSRECIKGRIGKPRTPDGEWEVHVATEAKHFKTKIAEFVQLLSNTSTYYSSEGVCMALVRHRSKPCATAPTRQGASRGSEYGKRVSDQIVDTLLDFLLLVDPLVPWRLKAVLRDHDDAKHCVAWVWWCGAITCASIIRMLVVIFTSLTRCMFGRCPEHALLSIDHLCTH